MKTAMLAAIGLTLSLLAPAGAAYAAEIDCGVEQTAPALRASMDAMVSRVLHADDYQPTSEDETISMNLYGVVETCATQYKWNDAKKEHAMRYTLLRMTSERAATELRGLGVPTATLDKIVAAHPEIFAPKGDEPPRAASRDILVAEATAAGIPMTKPDVEMLVLAYFGSVTLRNLAAADFAKV